MRLSDYDTSRKYTATVRSINRLTPSDCGSEVKEINLQVDVPFSYQAGQSIGVIVPGPHDYGHEHHFRLYTLADIPTADASDENLTLVVKRCTVIDEYSGEEYRGIASNYLCDLHPNDSITITGPYAIPFTIPNDIKANLLMIGMGTGIAPFRAFVKHIYENLGGWQGKVRLFYGAKTGLELLYMNKQRDDFSNYYDEETFQAFSGLSVRPNWNEDIALAELLELQEREVWDLLCDYNTYVYIAGHSKISLMLEQAFSDMAESKEKWQLRKKEMIAGKRWMELLY